MSSNTTAPRFAAAFEGGVTLMLAATDLRAARAEVIEALNQGWNFDDQDGFKVSATLYTLGRELPGEEEADEMMEVDGTWYEIADEETVETYVTSKEEAFEDADVLAEEEGEFSTYQVIKIGRDFYYREANGGSRGAHQPASGPCGDWSAPREVRSIDEQEAKRLMLEFGLSPRQVAARLG